MSNSCNPINCSTPGSSVNGISPGKKTRVGCHFFLQGIIWTQGSNLRLLHCRWILYQLSHQGSPINMEYVTDRYNKQYIFLLESHSLVDSYSCSAFFVVHLAQIVKNLPEIRETWIQSLSQEFPLEKTMATHSSILAWRIPKTKEPGELHSMGFQRKGHDNAPFM